jgi:hypothetical protein
MKPDSDSLEGESKQIAPRKQRRSKPIAEHDQIDGRTTLGRRFRTLIRDLTDELGGALTPAETALVKLAAATIVRGEQFQAHIIRGEAIDDAELVRLVNTTSRILRELNAQKAKRKAAGPTALQAWLAARETEVETDEADDTAE